MESIVCKLGTCFASPEEMIVKHGETADALYIIIQGDCTVDMISEKRVLDVACKLLVEGNHFGEVGVLFKTTRTCSVISRNYNTMCRLKNYHFRTIISDYPIYQEALKKYVYHHYRDSRKLFYYDSLSKIDFLKDMDAETFHEIYFKLKQISLESRDTLLKENDENESIYVVEYGYLEVFSTFDGHEFVIDFLGPGTILGHRSCFTDDTSFVNIRAPNPAYVTQLTVKDL